MSRRRLVLLGLAALVLFAVSESFDWAWANEYGPVDAPLDQKLPWTLRGAHGPAHRGEPATRVGAGT